MQDMQFLMLKGLNFIFPYFTIYFLYTHTYNPAYLA